jgi:hypothetical protein
MTPSATQHLAKSLSRFSPEVVDLAQAVLQRLDRQLPGATRFLYDKANALVVGYGPNDRASDAVLSIGVYRRWVNLYFLDGAELEDTEHLLQGSGTRVRFFRVQRVQDLDGPGLRGLIQQALQSAHPRIPRAPGGRFIIKSVRATRR